MKIKKGDQVLVLSGKQRGKTAKVEKVMPKTGQAIVSGVNLYKKHLKPSRKNPHGGIIDKTKPIDIANVQIICPHCNRATRVSRRIKNNLKIRICLKCQENLDAK